MKCLKCNTILEENTTKPRKFCSDKCRMAYKRDNEQIENEHGTLIDNEREKTDTIVEKTNITNFTNYSAQDLYSSIDSYNQDTWKDSPEFAELEKRLKEKTAEELKAEGYFVPNWKK